MEQHTLGPLLPSRLVLQHNTAKFSQIQETLATYFQLSTHKAHRNPAPNPVSIERCHLNELKSKSYYVSQKADGVRYLLLLGRFQGSACRGRQQAEYAVMIDRSMKVFEIRVQADYSFYDGSLFDGELVWEYETDAHLPRQVFLVFDCIAHKGTCHYDSTYQRRLDLVYASFPSHPDFLQEHIQQYVACLGNRDAMCFVSKPVYPFQQLTHLLEQPLYHATDGLVFTPNDQPVGTGRVPCLFKWKEHHTIDFKFKYLEGSRRVILYTDEGQEHRADDVDSCNVQLNHRQIIFLAQPNPELDQYLEQPLQQARQTRTDLEFIAECEAQFDKQTRNIVMLNVVRLRTDKLDANDRLTIERTLVNIREAITIDDIKCLLNSDSRE